MRGLLCTWNVVRHLLGLHTLLLCSSLTIVDKSPETRVVKVVDVAVRLPPSKVVPYVLRAEQGGVWHAAQSSAEGTEIKNRMPNLHLRTIIVRPLVPAQP